MPASAFNFADLFVAPPGELFYFLAVFILSQVSVFMALGWRLRRRDERAASVYTLAAGGIVVTWVLFLLGALFALVSGLPARALLPPLERAAQVATLIGVGWAFLAADDDHIGRNANLGALGLLAGVVVFYLVNALSWVSAYTLGAYNADGSSTNWLIVLAACAVLGIGLTVWRVRTMADVPLKLLFFAILLIGAGLALAQTDAATLSRDAVGASRMAFVAALVLLPVVIYRAVVGGLEGELIYAQQSAAQSAQVTASRPQMANVAVSPEAQADETGAGTSLTLPSTITPVPLGIERESAQLMKALGIMLEGATPNNIPQRVLTSALNSLKADVGAIFMINDAHYADLLIGTDRVIDNREIAGVSLSLEMQPTLLNAIERRQQRALYPDRNEDELADLYTRMDISGKGPVYFQPLTRAKTLVGVLLVALPYAGRELTDSEQELLKGIGIIGASLLALSNASNEAKMEAESRIIQAVIQGIPPTQVGDSTALLMWEQMRGELEQSRGQVETLNAQIGQLRDELDRERNRVASALDETGEGHAASQRIIALNDDVLRLMEERDRLSAQLRDSEAALASAATDDNLTLYQTLLSNVRQEETSLTAQRDLLRDQLDSLREDGGELVAEPASLQVNEQVAEALIARLQDEKTRTEQERDALAERMAQIEGQFTALGIQGGAAGMAQIVGQLYEQRAGLQARFDALKTERDALAAERASLQDLAAKEGEREGRLQILQAEVTHLASDREAIGKQRERLKSERDDMATKLNALRDEQARLLAELAGYAQELTEAHMESGQLRELITGLQRERSDLVRERDRLLAERNALDMERDGLIARVEGDRARLQEVSEEGVGSLTRMIDDLTRQRAELERELADTRASLATVEDQLDLAHLRRNGAGGVQPQIVYRPDNPELLVSLVEDLRTPMTSIVGYVDLILNESAGILGEMQRKFMQRIASNLLRLQTMMDDLIQITALDAGTFRLHREWVDMVELVEDALTIAAQPLREKGLNVHLRLDEDAPPLTGDREALAQVVGQLLTNAYLASPPDGDLYIRVQEEEAAGQNGHAPDGDMPSSVIHLQVEDRGGGIAPEDLAGVFTRKYRAENPLIQGLGDTGVGLAVAQALVNAHGGTIWVETQAGVGSTFHAILPLPEAEREIVEMPDLIGERV